MNLAVAVFKLSLVSVSIMAVLWRFKVVTGPGALALIMGMGGVLGPLLAGVGMWMVLIVFGPTAHWLPEIIMISVSLALIIYTTRLPPSAISLTSSGFSASSASSIGALGKGLIGCFCALIAVRFLSLLPDVVAPRLFPWDAWLVWGYEARVWFETGQFIPFLAPKETLTADSTAWVSFTLTDYPKVVPSMMLWLSGHATQWTGQAPGLAWLWAATAIGCLLFGLLRQLRMPTLVAVIAVYLWWSLPIINAHTALHGYADLWLSAVLGLISVIFLLMSVESKPWHWLGIVTGLILLPLIKIEGIYWDVGIVFAALVHHYRPSIRAWLLLTLPWLVIGVIGYVIFDLDWIHWVTGGRLEFAVSDLMTGLWGVWRHTFVFYDWHLLFYAVFLCLLALPWAYRYVHHFAGFLALVAFGLVIIVGVLPVSGGNVWLGSGSLFSRVVIHFSLPMVIFVVMVAHGWRQYRGVV